MNKVMVLKGGSPALHKLGDIGREEDDFIRVHDETNTHYIGNFEDGFGFIDVKFKKEDCRELTEEEVKNFNGKWYTINGNLLYKIYVDKKSNVIKGKCIMKKGIIDRVLDVDGFSKRSKFIGLNVEFPEDIELGRSLVMFTDQGSIQTSKVIKLNIQGSYYVIHTKNSIYFIETF